MRGDTVDERAKVRDCLSVLSEAVDFWGFYSHSASKLFEKMAHGKQSPEAAKQTLVRVHEILRLLERMADPVGPWPVATSSSRPTIVDCVTMATMQFTESVYDYDLTKEHPRLKHVYQAFIVRESAEMEEVPEIVKELGHIMSVR